MTTKNLRRIDRTELRKAEKTQQGFLRAPAFATRTGVFKYLTGDGKIVSEYRPAEEVFNAASMATLANVPVTNLHPKPGFLDPKNAKAYTIGFTGDIVERVDEKFVQVYVTVFDQGTMDQAENGMQEVSCGYTCDHEVSPGIYEGEAYDVIQRNIVYNHLAIVPRGRAGPEVKLRLDADEGEMITETEKTKESPKMGMIKIKDKEYDASPELMEAHEANMKDMSEQMDAMTKQLDAFKAAKPAEGSAEEEKSESPEVEKKEKDAADPENKETLESVKKEKDAAQAKADSLESEITKLRLSQSELYDAKNLHAAVTARMRVLAVASRKLPSDTKLDEMTDMAIKREVIKADSPEKDLTGKSDEYLNARYDHIEESLDKVISDRRGMGSQIVNTRKDSANDKPDSEAARLKMMEESKNAYKRPDSSQKK